MGGKARRTNGAVPVSWAESLHLLRQELRPMIQDSALCRAEDFARDFCNLMTDVVQRHGLR